MGESPHAGTHREPVPAAGRGLTGLCVDLRIAEASGYAERDEAMKMLRRLRRRGFQPRTLGADKGYDAGRTPHEVLALGIEPRIAVNDHASRTSPARRFVKRRGYRVSQFIRQHVEEIFGWARSIGGLRLTRYKGRKRTPWTAGYLVATAYNLLHISRLTAQAAR